MKYTKGTPEHAEIVQKIVEVASDTGSDLRSDYSGRGMFGALCYGIDGQDEVEILMAVGAAGLPRPKIDSMGMGVIVYWPQIEGE